MVKSPRAWFGLLVVLLASTLVTLGQVPAAAEADWELAGLPNGARSGYGDDISAANPESVWVNAGGEPWRRDRGGWESHPVTDGPDEVSVQRISAVAEGSAWAAGRFETGGAKPPWVGRWTGSAWQAVPPPQFAGYPPYGVTVWAVEAVADDDVWLLYSADFSRRRHAVLHYDGKSWTDHPLRGPGCGLFQVSFANLAIRRGQAVVAADCTRDDGARFTAVWELVNGRWADRGTFGYTGELNLLDALPGGRLVVQNGATLLERNAAGEWTRRAPDIENYFRGTDMTVDPTNGAVLAVTRRFTGQRFRGAVCTQAWGRWGCRNFPELAYANAVDVDPLSGTRWIVGGIDGSDAIRAWRRVPSARQ